MKTNNFRKTPLVSCHCVLNSGGNSKPRSTRTATSAEERRTSLIMKITIGIASALFVTVGFLSHIHAQEFVHFYDNNNNNNNDDNKDDGNNNSKNNNNNDNHDTNELIAVIHIGPMKTGSSAIQASLGKVLPEMSKVDGYEDAGFAMGRGIEAYHMIGCFRPDSKPYDPNAVKFELACHPNALELVHKVALERQHNLIITAEYLTDPKTDLVKFKEFLQPWPRVKVVAYYRRYYDWLLSFHNQIFKKVSTPNRMSVVDFLHKEAKFHFLWENMYFVDAFDRYRDANITTEFDIINSYHLPKYRQDIRVAFYCEGLINAHGSCTKFQKYLDNHTEPEVENPSKTLIYSDLVHYAMEMNLFRPDPTRSSLTTISEAVRITQHHQEKILKKQSHEFHPDSITCPDSTVIDHLYERSKQVEQDVFPDYYYHGRSTSTDTVATTPGETSLREHFDSLKQTKFCHVDGKIVLEKTIEWQEFFRELNENQKAGLSTIGA